MSLRIFNMPRLSINKSYSYGLFYDVVTWTFGGGTEIFQVSFFKVKLYLKMNQSLMGLRK